MKISIPNLEHRWVNTMATLMAMTFYMMPMVGHSTGCMANRKPSQRYFPLYPKLAFPPMVSGQVSIGKCHLFYLSNGHVSISPWQPEARRFSKTSSFPILPVMEVALQTLMNISEYILALRMPESEMLSIFTLNAIPFLAFQKSFRTVF